MYVASKNSHYVQYLDSNGNLLQQIGGTVGSGDGQLSMPMGVAISTTGDLYVCEYGNNRVQVFDVNLCRRTKWHYF